MITTNFQGKQLSLLGFGTLRFPTHPDKSIDEAQVKEMFAYAISNGVNYFDTAWPYHNGESEIVTGKILSEYPRDSYYLADKYPGHMVMEKGYYPAEIFEEQLKKCGVDYFDFYLLHNVYEKSMDVYLDPQWGIIDYFKEQKRLGRIKHLGFSCHASTKGLEEFLDIAGKDMEFCQIQLNYLDWTLQDAKGKYDLLTERGIPVWVMEPVRGGKLAKFPEAVEEKMKAFRPEESIPAWCFRFLQSLPNVQMVLSGMSNMQQTQDNVKTFQDRKLLSETETALIFDIADRMKASIPCTACRYCCDGCPMELDIPGLINTYNEILIHPSSNIVMRMECMPEEKRPSACISCGQCSQSCPQNIDIPAVLKKLADRLDQLPTWEETCRKMEQKV